VLAIQLYESDARRAIRRSPWAKLIEEDKEPFRALAHKWYKEKIVDDNGYYAS